jgi:hypothetical protein
VNSGALRAFNQNSGLKKAAGANAGGLKKLSNNQND